MWFFVFCFLNGKTTFVREMRYLWSVQKLLSVTFGGARLQPSFWKGSLDKDRASFHWGALGGRRRGEIRSLDSTLE